MLLQEKWWTTRPGKSGSAKLQPFPPEWGPSFLGYTPWWFVNSGLLAIFNQKVPPATILICGKISCLCSYARQYSTVPARFSVAFCSFVKLRFCFLPSSFRVWPHLHENVLSNDDFR